MIFMKTNCALVAFFGVVTCGLVAAPLTETTAVHLKPDASSPAFSYLKAGTEPTVANGTTAPAGWVAVQLAGPHTVFVQNKDVMKSLDVRPGAELRVAPKLDAAILSVAAKDDALEISGLQGRWTQLQLKRSVTGYIKAPGVPANAIAAQLPVASVPPAARGTPSTAAPVAPPPVAPSAYGSAAPGQAAPMVNLGDGGTSALPRMFQGKFVTTRSPFKPRRPYDWALTDEGGARFAYLDVSRLLQTEQIEKYTDRTVAVFGAAKPIPGTNDFVIVVESLQLR